MRTLAVLATLFWHCAAATPPAKAPMTNTADRRFTIEANVTNEGVECPAVRTDDGKLYTIAAVPADRVKLKPGTRVRITGSIAEMSTCMQGTTISAETIEVLRAGSPPAV